MSRAVRFPGRPGWPWAAGYRLPASERGLPIAAQSGCGQRRCSALRVFFAEGRCEGSITGRFRGANFPRKEGAEGPFRPDFRAVIEAGDGAMIMMEWHGYGRAYPQDAARSSGHCFTWPTASPTAG